MGNTGKRLPSKLQWSRKTIFLASGLNLAGELFLPSQSPRLLSTTHGDTVCCLFPTQIGFAVSQLNSPQPKPSPLGLSPLTHFLSTYSSTLNPPLNSVLSPIYLCSNPTHAFASFLARIRTHFLSKWVHYSPIHDMYLLSPNPRISHIGGQDCNKGGTA